jgi:hypothetical protein
MRTISIFLAVFFIALPSYCSTNFSPKNVKGEKAAISQTTTQATITVKAVVKEVQSAPIAVEKPVQATTTVKAVVKEAQDTPVKKSEVKKEKSKQSEKEIYDKDEEVIPASTYYIAPTKMLLDEKTRGIQAPKGTVGGYGSMREKMVKVKCDSNVSYDDDIYLTKDDVRGDVVTTLTPGVYGYIGNDEYTAMGFYEADVLIYSRYWQESRVNQTIGGRVDLFKQGRIKLSLQDSLRPTTDPASSEIAPFTKRVNNNFSANARYDLSPKTTLAVNYDQYLQYYVTDGYKQFSYIQHTIAPTFYYHLTPKISLTGEYDLGITNYMGGANYNSLFNQARAGIEGTLSPKSRVYLRGGYQYRRYYNSDTKNTQAFVMQLGYDYLISPKTTLQVVGSSDINESVWNFNSFYKSYNLYASLTYHMLYNIDIKVNGIYILSDYPHEVNTVDGMRKRCDNLYGAGANIHYNLRTWMSAYAGYDYKFRNSNIRDVEYADNIISGGLKLNF